MSAFSVNVQELDDGPRDLREKVSDSWLRTTLAGTEIEPAGSDDGRLDVSLMKNGKEILVRGRLEVNVQVPCSRTLDPAVYRLRPEVFLLLAPGPAKAEDTSADEQSAPRRRRRGGGDKREGGDKQKAERGAPRREGSRKGGKAGGWENDPVLSEEDAAQDTYSGDQVVLDGFLREFILLEVPMAPLREDLRGQPFEANPPLPGSPASSPKDAEALDPRLSPLAELKARLESKE